MTMKANHFFVSCSGTLHDTRREDWASSPLRDPYSAPFRSIDSGAELRSTLRCGPYAWPGGYELMLFTSDGACLCFACTREHLREVTESIRSRSDDGWRVVGTVAEHESDEPLVCDHCGRSTEEVAA